MLSRVLRKFFGFEARLNQRERLPRRVIPRLEQLEERTLLSGNLQVGLVAPPTAAPGASITYMVTVANVDSAAASDVSLTESLPSGVAYQSQAQTGGPSFTLSQSGNVVNDTIDSLAAGASASFSITGVVASDETAGAVLTDAATATGSGAYSGSVPWSTTVEQADSGSGSGSNTGSDSRDSVAEPGAAAAPISDFGSGVGFNTATGSTSTTLSSNHNPSNFGQTVTFTAVVAGQFNTMASEGYVTFFNGAVNVGTGSLAATSTTSQYATFATAALPVGVYSYTAQYAGNASFITSTSNIVHQTVNPAATTTTTLASTTNPTVVGQAVTLTATVSGLGAGAGGSVNFYNGGTLVGTEVLGPQGAGVETATYSTTALPAGVYSYTASYLGGGGFAASTSGALTQTVNLDPTSMTLSSSPDPSLVGNPVTVTATVYGLGAASGGIVTFFNGGVQVGIGTLVPQPSGVQTATYSTTALPVGFYSYSASYAANATYAACSAAAPTQTVQALTSTYITSSADPSLVGNSVTFTATVVGGVNGVPTGSVTFLVNGYSGYPGATATLTPTGSDRSLATFSLVFPLVGSNTITAQYNGSAIFIGSSASLTQTVQTAPTSTYITSSADPSLVGNPVTFTATVVGGVNGVPTGSVTFLVNGYSGYPGATATLTPTGSDRSLATFSLVFPLVGSNTITAQYNAVAPFTTSSASLTQTVQTAPTSTYITSSADPSLVDNPVTFTATVVGGVNGVPTGSVTFLVNGYGGYPGATATLTPTGSDRSLATFPLAFGLVGSNTITAQYNAVAPFTTSSASLTQTVNQASTSTYVSSNLNPSLVGASVAFTALVVGQFGGTPTGNVIFKDNGVSLGSATLAPNGTGAQAVLTRSNLLAGSHAITAVYAGDANYSGGTAINSWPQTVSLNPAAVTLTSSDASAPYGQSVTLTAAVAGAFGLTPTGTVTFLDGTTALGSMSLTAGQAALVVPGLTVGVHNITVNYSGDAAFAAGASSVLNQVVNNQITLSPTADQDDVVGDSVFLPIEATAANGDAPTYTETGLPAGLSIDPDSGYITGDIAIGAGAGSPYSVTVTAADGAANASQTFLWAVSAFSINNPGDQTNAVGDDVYVPTGGYDPVGDALTFSASNLPPGVAIDPASGDITGAITGTASDSVPYAVTLSATDGTNTESQTFNWTVTHVFVVNPGDQQNADGDNVILPVNAGENDGTPVTVTAVGLPPGLSVNSADNIVGTISNSADTNSPYTVTLTATDGTYSNSATFQWTVSRLTLANPGDQTNNDGDAVDLPISVTDNLGDAVTFGAAGLPGGLTIDASTGTITGTIAPTADAGGPYSVTVTATGGGASASQTFIWNVNNPITVSSVFDQSNALGDVVTLPVSATTATGDALTYSAAGLPPGVSVNSSTGLISGTISAMASITTPYDVTVTVNDGAISANASFVWTVGRLTLTNPGDQTNASGDTVSLALTASDNMGDTLSYSATGLPTGLTINSSTGLISGVIALDADADGPYTTTVSVTGGGATASQTFTWNVARIIITDPGDQNSADNDVVSLQINLTDHNGDALTYSATGLPPGLTINASGLISGTIASDADLDGPYTVTVTAGDANGHSASDTFFWSVTQLTLTNPGTQLNADGDTVTLALAASGPSGAALTYTANGLPPGLTINTATGVISGLLSMTADAGAPYTTTVTAADGLGASASQTFTWNIDQLILDNPGDQTYAEGQSVTLPIVVDDNDGAALTFSVTGLPDGLSLGGTNMMSVSGNNATIVNATGAPAQSASSIDGTINPSDLLAAYNVTLSVSDGLGLVARVNFIVTVESYTVQFLQNVEKAGYNIVNGHPVNLPTPDVAMAVVSDPSRIPFITFAVTGQADRIALGQVNRGMGSVISVQINGRSATPSNAISIVGYTIADTTLAAVDNGITKATVPVQVVVPSKIRPYGLPQQPGILVKGKPVVLNNTTVPVGIDAVAPLVEMAVQYAVTIQVPVVDQFGGALPSIYAGSAVFEKWTAIGITSFKSINVTLGTQSSYPDPVGDLAVFRDPNNPLTAYIINPNLQGANPKNPGGQSNQQFVANWLAGNGPALPLPPMDARQNIQIQIGGHLLVRGIVQRHVICTAAGFLTIDWPDYAELPH